MAGREREVKVTVLGDSSSGQRALSQLDDHADRVGNRFDGLGKKLASFGKVAALGIGAAAVGVGAFLKSSVEAAEESRKVGAQTEAVIKSTGGAANVTAAQVGAYADKLAALTGIDDEVIASTENMLLTFTNVRNGVGKGNDIFNQATKTALDMSVALGTDSKESAIQLGKALNDPIKGISALQRVGVTFTDSQKEQIKTLVESGHTMEAQKVILKELATEFGGSAEAAASPMARLKVVVGNLQEELGARLLPVAGKVATFLADKLPGAMDAVSNAVGKGWDAIVGGFQNAGATIGSSVGGVEGILLRFGATVRGVVDFVRNAFAAGRADTTWLDSLVGGIRAFIGAFQNASDGITSSGFAGKMEAIAIFLHDNLQPVLIGVGAALLLLVSPWLAVAAAVVYAYTHFQTFHDVVDAVISTVVAIVSGFVDLVTTIWTQFGDQLTLIAQGAWTAISSVVEGALQIIRGVVQVVTSLIHGDWAGVWEGIKGILSGAWTAIHGIVEGALGILRGIISAGLEILSGIVSAAFDGIVDFIASIPGRILGALGGLGDLLYGAGQDLIWGMLHGIESMAGALGRAAVNVAKSAVNAVKGFLGIGSPSKLFAGFGVNMAEGMVLGLGASEGSVARAGSSLAAASVPTGVGGLAGGIATAGAGVVINVAGSVVTERNLVEAVQAGLLQKQRRVPTLGLS